MVISVAIVEACVEFRNAFAALVDAAPDMRLVGVTAHPQAAMALIEHGPLDVLLIDFASPRGRSLALIRAARRRWPAGCKVMVVSLCSDEKHVLASLQAGATGYLLKDSSSLDLVARIRELHVGGSPLSPLIASRLLARLALIERDETPAKVTLSGQERQVLAHMARGCSHAEVARVLGISSHTEMSYVKRIYQKLHVHSKTEALYEARRLGLIVDPFHP